jgi:hypothetical protein
MGAFRSGQRKGTAARPDLTRNYANGLANRNGYPYHGVCAEYVDTGTSRAEAGYSPKDDTTIHEYHVKLKPSVFAFKI